MPPLPAHFRSALPSSRRASRDAVAGVRGHCAATSRRSRRAFTLVELIVVIIVIGVLAGMIVVRLGSNTSRRADVALAGVRALLETIAHRQTVSSTPLALHWNPERRELWLDVLRSPSLAEAETAFPKWVRDPMSRPVFIPEDVEFRGIELERQPVRQFPVIFTGDVPRPTIEVYLGFGEVVDVVALLPFALEPVIYGSRFGSIDDQPYPVDLDASGQRENDW